MYCKNCGAEIPAADVNLERLIAKCQKCNEVFSFADNFPQRVSARRERGLLLPKPARFLISEAGVEKEISYRWFSWTLIPLLFFCIAWDSFLVFWYSMAIFGVGKSGFAWIAIIFPIGHVAVGVGLTYYLLAGFFNRTHIRVDARSISVQHGPIPWWGHYRFPAEDVDQLYCDEEISRGKNDASTHFVVKALLVDGKTVKLVKGLSEREEAFFLEQKLEEWLAIRDRPVAGELAR